jgi:hypothetical protein
MFTPFERDGRYWNLEDVRPILTFQGVKWELGFAYFGLGKKDLQRWLEPWERDKKCGDGRNGISFLELFSTLLFDTTA